MKAVLLGCGDAYAIPRPGCTCPQCTEAREVPGLARMRSGVLLETATERVLLDCSPDVARALDREGLSADAIARVVISHRHNDHCYGMFELVRLRSPEAPPLVVHANPDTREVLRTAFPGLFRPDRPGIELAAWGTGVRIELDGLAIEGFETHHYPDIETTAFLLEFADGDVTRRVVYATDMGSELPTPRERLEGLDLFIGDGTYLGGGGRGHPGTDRMIEIARELGARRVAITHVGHWQVDAAEAARRVGDDVVICRDRDALASLLP